MHQLRYPTGASHCRYHGSPAVRRQQLAAARGALAPALRRFSLRGAATQRAATGRKLRPSGIHAESYGVVILMYIYVYIYIYLYNLQFIMFDGNINNILVIYIYIY